MSLIRDKVLHRRSAVLGKRPAVFDLEDAELGINYHKDEPGIFIKDYDPETQIAKIRKIGPIHFADTAPNSNAVLNGFPIELSHGEMWVDSNNSDEEKYTLKIWNENSNDGEGGWIVVGQIYGRKDGNLDQFLNGEDGNNFIHTEGIRLKINNKTALAGFSTDSGDNLIINENNEFGSGVTLNAKNYFLKSEQIEAIGDNVVFKPHEGRTFTTDSVSGLSETIFTYEDHGLFEGEKIYVLNELIGGGESPVAGGEYFIADVTLSTFRLKTAGGLYVSSGGNISISYAPELIIDKDRNILSSGNFGLKTLDDELPEQSNQIIENYWDVYHNPSNGNVRVFARTGNEINQIETSTLTVDVKSAEISSIIEIGTPVFYSGRDFGSRLSKVKIADASSADSMRAIGVAKTRILPGGRGVITILGEVSKVNTSQIGGAFSGPGENIGRVLYIKAGGGLTFDKPNTLENIAQPIGILLRQDASDGAIMVNHPSSFESLPNIPENYIWAGVSGDKAVAHALSPTSFKRTFNVQTNTWTIGLADNIEFGAYKFNYDFKNGSRIETNVSTSTVDADEFLPFEVESFSTSYRSAKYVIQISGISEDGATPVYQISEILVIHNGIDAFMTEFGTISTFNNERLGIFDAKIDQVNNKVILTYQKSKLIEESVNVKSIRTSILV